MTLLSPTMSLSTAVAKCTMSDMMSDEAQAARHLAGQTHRVSHVSGRKPWRDTLRWISRGKLGRPHGVPVAPDSSTPWHDTMSGERPGWRERAANLDGHIVFAVDYQTCGCCQLGWVEQPYTDPPYQRCGLARAGLVALRTEHPGLSWHTLGSHFSDSQAFWTAVGAGVPGGYEQRHLCPHVHPG